MMTSADCRRIANMAAPTNELLYITPALARSWLGRTPAGRNRPISRRAVSLLVGDLLAGRWQVTNQGIGLGDDYSVYDGQHRLVAIAESGVSVLSYVTVGITHQAALTAIDCGKIRTQGQRFAMEGIADAVQIAAIARAIHVLETENVHYQSKSSPGELLDVYNNHRETITAVLSSHKRRIPGISRGVVAVMIERLDGGVGRSFFEGLINGHGLAAGNPTILLRDWLTSRKGTQSAPVWSRSIACVQAFAAGDKLTRLPKHCQRRYEKFCDMAKLPVNRSLWSAVAVDS